MLEEREQGVEDATPRVRAWRNRMHAVLCDAVEPWEHGTIVRASAYPDYFQLNVVRVERDPGLGVPELAAVAERGLAGLRHRLIEFDDVEAAAGLRPGFEAAGWESRRLAWMRHAGPALGAVADVEEVEYDAVHSLRATWLAEDFPALDPGSFFAEAKHAAALRDARVLAIRDSGKIVGYAQIERDGDGAEITQVYVRPDSRGAGRGDAITRVAIAHAGGGFGICGSAQTTRAGRKQLYARLGFEPAWRTSEFLRLL